MKVKRFVLILYAFFFAYFISYIGESTPLKYVSLVIFQAYLVCNYKKIELHKIDSRTKVIIFFCCFSLVLSLVINFSIGATIKIFSIIDLFVLALLCCRSIVNMGIKEDKLLKIITNTLFVTLIIAYLTHYNDIVYSIGRNSSVGIRHVFGFVYPSIVGYLCFILFVFTFYIYIQKEKKLRTKLMCILKIALALIMMYQADIRSALVSVVCFITLFYFEQMPKSRSMTTLKLIIGVLIAIIGTIYILSADLSMDKLNFIFSERFIYYGKAIQEILDNNSILFGLGAFRNSDVNALNKIQIDNSYLDYFYQFGIISLLTIVMLLIKLYKRIVSSIKLFNANRLNEHDIFGLRNYGLFIKAFYISALIYSLVEKNLFSISSALGIMVFVLAFDYLERPKMYI